MFFCQKIILDDRIILLKSNPPQTYWISRLSAPQALTVMMSLDLSIPNIQGLETLRMYICSIHNHQKSKYHEASLFVFAGYTNDRLYIIF